MAKGCNIGNQVITNPSGSYPLRFEPFRELYNGQVLQVYYNNMQTYEGVCYITNPYGFNLQLCVSPDGSRGSVINYTESQITCVPKVNNAPLDDDVIGLIIVVLLVIITAYSIWRKERNNTMFG